MAQNKSSVERFLKILDRTSSDSTFIFLNLEIADEYIFNNPDTAKYFVNRALVRSESTGDLAHLAKAYNYLGIIAYGKGQLLSALEYYQKSQTICKNIGERSGALKAMNNIGIIYNDLKDTRRAIAIYEEAYNANMAMGESIAAASNLYNIVSGYLEMKDLPEAQEGIFKLERLHRLNPDAVNPASLKAEVYIMEGKLDSALVSLNEALYSSSIADDEYFMAGFLLRKAEIYRRKQLYVASRQDLYRAKGLIEENGFDELKLSCLRLEASLYSDEGLCQKAFEAQKSFLELKDSLDGQNNFNRISELNAKYEAEKREMEITRQQQMIDDQNANFRFAMITGSGLTFIIGLALFNIRRIRRLNKLLQFQNKEIKVQGQKILSSIDYARKIQASVLPGETVLHQMFGESFIYFRPKDIVSGDFYWFRRIGNKLYIAVIDCTGHGVPGAFMSLIANSKMNTAVIEFGLRKPEEILLAVHREIVQMLHQNDLMENAQDGMDIGICVIDTDERKIDYCGANNAIHILSGGRLEEYKSSPLSIGGTMFSKQFRNNINPFRSFEIPYKQGDYLFMYTDGVPDQLGGPESKKLNKERFRNLLNKLVARPLSSAPLYCDQFLEDWKQGIVQTDDILIFGAKLN